jgi:phosphatidylglycerol:prolipoprotein diacylglycerol transferase
MEHIVSFPGLGWQFTLNRVAFQIFGKDVYWYGIIIAAGFLLAALYASTRAKEFGLKSNDILDMLLYALPIGIVCARAYYVFFRWDQYKDHLGEIIAIWHGGLAIYGGIIGAVITVFCYCHFRKLRVGDMLDVGGLGLMIGQSIGRWGNFMNAEAFGRLTDLPWRMNIGQTLEQAGSMGYHPTFFYESMWNLLGFILLHFYSKKRKFSGEVFLLYIAWYGLGRFFIEGLRTDSLYVMGTGLRISQLIAIGSMAVALILIFFIRKINSLAR